MPRSEQIEGQRDFSLGEVDLWAKRRDDLAIIKSSARRCNNFRLLNSGSPENRPGRTALFTDGASRIEEVLMAPSQSFFLVFGIGYLRVYNKAGTQVFSTTVKGDGTTAIPWTALSIKNIVFAVSGLSIYITYGDGNPNNVPQVLTWDGVSQSSTWTLATFAELVQGSAQKRTFFYRISPQNITLQPSNTLGNITLTASAPFFVAGHVNTRIRWLGRQVLITSIVSSLIANATVEESLNNSAKIQCTTDPSTIFSIGDEIIGNVSQAKALVTGFPGSNYVAFIYLTGSAFLNPTGGTNDALVGPSGTAIIVVNTATALSPAAIAIWDDEVMNPLRGYPASCFFDQGRLGFCNFPAVPSGIGWSAIGSPTDLYIQFSTSTASNAIFEIAPGKSQVLFVLPGMESSEFVFADNAIYYIPITATNPLQPGSVAFNQLSSTGAGQVTPRPAEQSIVFVDPTGAKMRALQAPGAYYRPYVIDDLSEMHVHLFSPPAGVLPVAIAIPPASVTFEERYIYVLLNNGTYVVGKYQMRNGLLEPGPEGKPHVGWVPCSSQNGFINWIAAFNSDVIFTTTYSVPGAASVTVAELLDITKFVDAAVLVNAAPAPLAPPGGLLTGKLWMWADSSVTLWDGNRPMGTYQVDPRGNLVPQFIDAENLSSPNLIAGQPWTALLEPWIPNAPPGQNAGQRMYPRKVSRTAIAVQNSTGFVLQRLQDRPTPVPKPIQAGFTVALISSKTAGNFATGAAGGSARLVAPVGSTVIVAVDIHGAGFATGVTDSAGNTYSPAVQGHGVGLPDAELWTAQNISTALPVAGTWTVTFSTGTSWDLMGALVAVPGVGITFSTDKANQSVLASAASFSVPTGPLVQASELIVCTANLTNIGSLSAYNEAAGFRNLVSPLGGGSALVFSYAIAPSTAQLTWAPTFTGTAGPLSAVLASFKTSVPVPAQPAPVAFGSPLSSIRFPYYEDGEDATQAVPFREQTYWKRWLGRSYDPRIVILKDTSGPLRIVEFGNKVTV